LHLSQPHIVAVDRLTDLRIDPALSVTTTKVDDPQLVIGINDEIFRFCITPYNAVLMQRLEVLLILLTPLRTLTLIHLGAQKLGQRRRRIDILEQQTHSLCLTAPMLHKTYQPRRFHIEIQFLQRGKSSFGK
jgi:hypothetical protein